MNLRDLEYVEAVARHRNFSHAAQHCHVSQPALSSQIKKLEQELGVPLFKRGTNHVDLTDFGKEILGAISQINSQVNALKETAALFRDINSHPFKLGMTPTLAPYLIGYFRNMLSTISADMRVILVEDKPVELARMVQNREIDVALLARKSHERICQSTYKMDLEFNSLWLEPLYLGVREGNPLLQQASIRAEDVPAEQLIRFNIPFGYDLEKSLPNVSPTGENGTHFDVSAARFETVCRHVSHSDDCTIVNAIAAEQFKQDNWGLAFIEFEDEGNMRDLGVVSRSGYQRQNLLEEMTSYISQSPPKGALPMNAIAESNTHEKVPSKLAQFA